MVKNFVLAGILILASYLAAQDTKNIQLIPPDLSRGETFMKAVSERASAYEFDNAELSLQDISDLLWAANGINRPEKGKRTAPSAMNAQDIDIYVFMQEGVYFYNPKEHILEFKVEGDHRDLIAGSQTFVMEAPFICLLVSDISRFNVGEKPLKLNWGAMDAGIVSQNINLFCAATGLVTRPRASMDVEKITKLLSLSETQYPMLNNPVSHKKN